MKSLFLYLKKIEFLKKRTLKKSLILKLLCFPQLFLLQKYGIEISSCFRSPFGGSDHCDHSALCTERFPLPGSVPVLLRPFFWEHERKFIVHPAKFDLPKSIFHQSREHIRAFHSSPDICWNRSVRFPEIGACGRPIGHSGPAIHGDAANFPTIASVDCRRGVPTRDRQRSGHQPNHSHYDTPALVHVQSQVHRWYVVYESRGEGRRFIGHFTASGGVFNFFSFSNWLKIHFFNFIFKRSVKKSNELILKWIWIVPF